MKKTSLIDAFEIHQEKRSYIPPTDYEIFKDKVLLDELRTKIIENLLDTEIPESASLNEYINAEIDRSIEGYDLTNLERSHIFNLIDNEINGYGPLTELLNDKNVTEIMVNGPDETYIEIDGQLIKDESVSFINEEHIIRTIQRMIQPLGRTIDASNPMVDSRLKDGSRINAIIPPLSLKGPVITIRKFKESIGEIEDLLRMGTMTPYMARFLESCITGKLNMIVCGGTGSGKTTLLNILSGFIGDHERIVTIEDAAELSLKQEHVIPLETRVMNYDRAGEITIRDLVINALRMRPDRIIVGECRGKEAFDMLQAMNTGHDGSLTTMHANSPQDALNRLETMVLMSGLDIPIKAIREYIYNAIDLVVNIERLTDGRRKVVSISELDGIEDGRIILKDIFAFREDGLTKNGSVNGEFIRYDFIPKVLDKLRSKGIIDIDYIFIEEKPKRGGKNEARRNN